MMSEFEQQHDAAGDERLGADALALDVLITRLADGEGCEADWEEFQVRAAADHGPWQALAEEQYVSRKLRAAFEARMSFVDGLELPSANPIFVPAVATDVDGDTAAPLSFGRHLLRQYGGWAAAAAVVLLWVVSGMLPGGGSDIVDDPKFAIDTPSTTGELVDPMRNDVPELMPVDLSADEHWAGYLAGSKAQELPVLVVEVGRDANGEPILGLVRRVLLSEGAEEIYRREADAYGNTKLVRRKPSGGGRATFASEMQ